MVLSGTFDQILTVMGFATRHLSSLCCGRGISIKTINNSRQYVFGIPVGAADLPCNRSVHSSARFFPATDRVINCDPECAHRSAGLHLFQKKAGDTNN